MIIVGVDYSLSSPAICIHEGNEWAYENCSFHFMSKKNPHTPGYHRYDYPEYKSEQDRYHKLAIWAFSSIIHDTYKSSKESVHVHIEGYAYGATGRVFQIAENTSTFKSLLWHNQYPLSVWAPSVIKKFATGRGNAPKDQLENSFVRETEFDLRTALGQTEKQSNPSSDIIDSYYVCKYGFHQQESFTSPAECVNV